MFISTSQICPNPHSSWSGSIHSGWLTVDSEYYSTQLSRVVLYYYNLNLFDFCVHCYIVQQKLLQSKKGVISELPFFNNRIQQPCLLNQNFGKGNINPIVHIDEKYVSQYLNCSDVKISASYTITLILCLLRDFYNSAIVPIAWFISSG